MMLSSVEFIGVFIIIGLLMVLSLWADVRRERREQEVLFAFDGACIHEVHDDVLVMHDELWGEVVATWEGTYILRVSSDLMWLAAIYVEDGILVAVKKQ